MLSKNNVGCCIITFNPTIIDFEKNLLSVVNQVSRTVIVDNGSQNFDEIQKASQKYVNVDLIPLKENLGIAAATNIAVQKVHQFGPRWILVLDQDSEFPKDGVKKYLNFLNDARKGNEKIGLLSPRYIDRNTEVSDNKEVPWEEVLYPIASGTLVSYSAWNEINGYDASFFIDRVDDDFDVRLRKAGYLLYQLNDVRLLHSIGCIENKNFLGLKIRVYNHSAFRKYYLARNNIWYYKKHGGFYNMLGRQLILVIKTTMYESSKKDKLKQIWRGISDGIRGKG